jgi:hypothetical protein
MSSLVGQIGQHHATTYVATKGAVTAFTKALALDEAANGVRVNSVSPGNIFTPLWQEAAAAAPDPERALAEGRAAQLVERMGTAEEVGRLCLFIAAEATFTTGVDHIISGGAELGYASKSGRDEGDASFVRGPSAAADTSENRYLTESHPDLHVVGRDDGTVETLEPPVDKDDPAPL